MKNENIKNSIVKVKCQDKECPYCHVQFKQINIKSFANHVRWCKENPNHEKFCGKVFKQKLSDSLCKHFNEKHRQKHGQLKTFEVICANKKCQKHFQVKEHEYDFPSKKHYFCSSQCAHSFSASNRSLESRQKTGNTLRTKRHIIECILCHKQFEAPICVNHAKCPECKEKQKPKLKYIGIQRIQSLRYDHAKELNELQLIVQGNSDISAKELAEIRRKVYRIYRTMCSFTFSIKDYPDEFDLNLLKDKKMYSAANHGNNQNGVSRDHMYSCAEGFKHNISPLIISHPANCQLITQRKNASKRTKCSITLEQLLKRIEIWEQKYGKYQRKNILSVPENLFNAIQNAKICHPMNYYGYSLIYETTTLKMKWWNVKDDKIPDGWQLEMPLELRLQHSHKKKM